MPDNRTTRSQAREVSAATNRTCSSRFLVGVERLLLASGLVLLACYGAARVDGFVTSNAFLEAFTAAASSAPRTHRIDAGLASSAPRPIASDGRHSTPSNAHRERDIRRGEATPGVPLAVLMIPKIQLQVPVLDGTDAITLNHATGRIAGTAFPGEGGNMGIAAHRDSYFRNLSKLRDGDTVELKTGAGTETYVVDRIQIVKPEDVSVLDPGTTPSLTLVTCYPFHYLGSAPQRYVVTASLRQDSAPRTTQGQPEYSMQTPTTNEWHVGPASSRR